ncbi:hypothetical protein KSB_22960 [Ktedonobacter robiniae]|uniref:Uncharacterized protein n=1 Tax=Ktedonobacter robiniae TaxID=2778365 RepID=A0ABQ3UMD6_9CHLR|nr:hypothetical protein KSB_22960 [Ktedonobacter robiniae]
MGTVGGQIGMVGRDEWFIEEAGRCQTGCSQDNGIDDMHDIWLKLIETAYEEGAKEIKLELRVKGERESRRADNLGPSVLFHAAFRA